jgi:hypothetical protein
MADPANNTGGVSPQQGGNENQPAANTPQQHTPGEWTYFAPTQSVYSVGPRHGVTNHEMHIADIRGHGYLTGGCAGKMDGDVAAAIQDANGRLIAAAPDLLEACNAALDSLCACNVPIEWDCRATLSRAISMATGNCPQCRGTGECPGEEIDETVICSQCGGSGKWVTP